MPAMAEPHEFTLEELTGRVRTHLTELPELRCLFHKEAVGPFLAMRAAAAADGIDLCAFSSFRDFDRQLSIWNGKFRGERPMQDRQGRPVAVGALDPAGRVDAILWWSALPGASRHHWGTDFDCIDGNALEPGYRFQLVPAEYAPGGPFERLTTWLDRHMHAFGFFRPYATDRGGVNPEPWHLSYAPVAQRALAALTPDGLRAVLAEAAIDGREEILGMLPALFARYVAAVDPAPQEALLSPRLS